MVALQSDSELLVPLIRLLIRSAARHAAVTTSINAAADSPYCHIEKAQIGNSANTTLRMMTDTSRPLC
jgi:hypothetical protein